MTHERSLNILHVARAPAGGIFRHMIDLARGQVARGHRVGIIVDSRTGGSRADAALASVAPDLALGVCRVPMHREINVSDVVGLYRVSGRIRELALDVVHGHGAKGGAFVRMATARRPLLRTYTPHGGSLHYGPRTPRGLVYGSLERLLMRRTDLFLFESAFARDAYQASIGTPSAIVRVVHNGLADDDFEPVSPAADATDIVFVGELRRLKGPDVLIDAIARLRTNGRSLTATIAGEGMESGALRTQIGRLGLTGEVRFLGHVPARQAFSLGRLVVVPSRAESLPYVVMEAAAAGMPVVATNVGGIPEIFGPLASQLVPPDQPAALAEAIAAALEKPTALRVNAEMLREQVRLSFSHGCMVDRVLEAYRDAIAARFRQLH
jgi:glycosyltransferase involved in cell wall biosynthesis